MTVLKRSAILLSAFTLLLAVTFVALPQKAEAGGGDCWVVCNNTGFYYICSFGASSTYCCYTNPNVGCQCYNCFTYTPVISHWC